MAKQQAPAKPASKPAPATTTAVATKTLATAVASMVASMVSDEVPDFLRGQSTEPGRGTENVRADDLVIPRLELIQDLSPARKKNDPNYIEGAEEGMLYNNVTRQLYGEEVLVVPVYYRKEWLIWKDRNEGGGFRGAFGSEMEAKAVIAEQDDAQHLEAVDTGQQFCLLIQPATGKVEEIVVSMPRTKAKVSRKWNSLIRMNGGDAFSRVYRLQAVPEKNSRNQDYYNFQVSPAGFPSKAIFDQAAKLYDSIASGAKDVSRDYDDEVAHDQARGGEY